MNQHFKSICYQEKYKLRILIFKLTKQINISEPQNIDSNQYVMLRVQVQLQQWRHYTTLRYTNYTTLHDTALHYTTVHHIALQHTTLHHSTQHYSTSHRIAALQYATLQHNTLNYMTLH